MRGRGRKRDGCKKERERVMREKESKGGNLKKWNTRIIYVASIETDFHLF